MNFYIRISLCLVSANTWIGCASPAIDVDTPPATQATAPQRSQPVVLRDIEGEPLFSVLPRDSIRAIDAPTFVTATEAAEFMAPDEPVIGVIGQLGTTRAYSAWQLDRHEVVNDLLDGRPITATW